MHRKRTSLKDIAEKTGLSVPSISQILNDKPCNFSSEATRKLVKDTAAELGYIPNFGYKVMLGEKTKTVSIIISQQRLKEEEHIQELILMLMDDFEARGYTSYISTFPLAPAENIEKTNSLISRGVEHFVFLGSPMGHVEIEETLRKNEKTYIGFNSIFSRNIDSDSCFGVEALIKHFLKTGRKNIKLLMEPCGMRIQALKNIFPEIPEKEILKKYVIQNKVPDFSLWNFRESCFKSGYDATARALKIDKTIDGILYLSDYFALGGAKYLLEKGYEISRDISIAGFNYTDTVRYSPFPISSVEHDTKTLSSKLSANVSGWKDHSETVKPFLHIR